LKQHTSHCLFQWSRVRVSWVIGRIRVRVRGGVSRTEIELLLNSWKQIEERKGPFLTILKVVKVAVSCPVAVGGHILH
jgi:hypothetical protein